MNITKGIIFLFAILTLSSHLKAQNEDKLSFGGGLKQQRDSLRLALINKTIKGNLSAELDSSTEKKWEGAFWAMELLLYKDKYTAQRLADAFKNIHKRSVSFQRALLEAAYCLYPDSFTKEVSGILKLTDNKKIFAMAANYLLRSRHISVVKVEKLMARKFAAWNNDPILGSLSETMHSENNIRPPLSDLFSLPAAGKLLIYSLQRKNRDYPGLLVVKGKGGKFLRACDGSVFSIPQLARSMSNLPGYLTNGSTPQGIFSIQGIGRSDNYFIGGTANVQTVLPYEVEPAIFFHSAGYETFDWITAYKELLPESWQNYKPIFQALKAGKAGRTEIIMHGTTIDPEYYAGQPYYPNTPTLGCLSAKEIWSDKDGRRLVSDQALLINALKKQGEMKGYLFLVELDDKQMPVCLDEVIMDLLQAEGE